MAVTLDMWLLLKNFWKKILLNHYSVLQFYFFFSMYKTPKWQPRFPCSMLFEKAKFGRCNSGFITEKSGRKQCKLRFFFSFLHATTGLALWRSSSLTICSELWAWNFDTQRCENRTNVHTQVLVWNFAGFIFFKFLFFFKTAALVWFLPVLCYCHNFPRHQMITEILDMQCVLVH